MVRRIIATVMVLAGLGLLVVGVATGFTGTNVLPGSGETSFNVEAAIGVGAGTFGEPKLAEQSLRVQCTESGFFDSLAFTSDAGSLSLTKAEDVEVQWTLQGPIPDSIRKTSNLGSIAKLGGSKTANFQVNNLPAGEYSISIDAFSNSGSDSTQTTVVCG